MSDISYWFWIGVINLIILTYQDFKNKMFVDDRRNYFMYGLTLSLISHYDITLFYLLAISFFFFFLMFLFKKTKAFGEADNNTLQWILTGLAIIHPGVLIFYLLLFAALTFLFLFMRKGMAYIFKMEFPEKTQFYQILLISFIFIGLIYKLY